MANKQTLWNAAMEARLVELLEEYRLVVEGDFGRPSEKAGLTKATKQAAWTTVAEKINRSVNNLTNVNKTYRYIVWWQRLVSQGVVAKRRATSHKLGMQRIH